MEVGDKLYIVDGNKLRKMLTQAGYQKIRNGRHEIWSNGEHKIAVPTHFIKPIMSHKIVTECNLIN